MILYKSIKQGKHYIRYRGGEILEGFYEDDIKELIRNKEHMFGDLGESVILFEKALSFKRDKSVKKVIADVLIFSEQEGLIGIEIKTERDSTQRLLRQMRAYSLNCDYVYVACHDKHVEKVEQILKRYQFPFVGIIAYTSFKGVPIAGMYKQAGKSPQKAVFHSLNMLWKTELLKLLSTLKHPNKVAGNENNPHNAKINTTQPLRQNTYTNRMKKSQIISEVISWLGEAEANRVLCDVFIQNRLDIERTIKLRHFNPPKKGDE